MGKASFDDVLALARIRLEFTTDLKKDELKNVIGGEIDRMYERIDKIRGQLRAPAKRHKEAMVTLMVYEKIKYEKLSQRKVAEDMAGKKITDVSNIRTRISRMYKKAQKIVEADELTQIMEGTM